jgi:hypothetical protein
LSPAFLADQYGTTSTPGGHRIINRLERLGESDDTTVWNITDKIPVVDAKGAIVGSAGITRAPDQRALSRQPHGLRPALAHMRAHFHHEITNRDLASISNMSLRAFERQFPRRLSSSAAEVPAKFVRIASRA